MTNQIGVKPPFFSVPERVRIDQSFHIQLSGLQREQGVTICAATADGELNKFESYAVFMADSEGRVDTGTHNPSEVLTMRRMQWDCYGR
ncbi:acyl-CoA thioesterase/BAAT N-terminal domain-containing protein [Paenibacillus sp. MSJ-34]|nr:acyl-CoA thioesterase/BAAT N-terminal domain-containing protein [Paenibacillus sp. MSJ-34]MBU5444805.1 acyl-CoA thioesterase/BAAT N-terminal domain-containing protein [Paenibacillus sp. MSJ-34]